MGKDASEIEILDDNSDDSIQSVWNVSKEEVGVSDAVEAIALDEEKPEEKPLNATDFVRYEKEKYVSYERRLGRCIVPVVIFLVLASSFLYLATKAYDKRFTTFSSRGKTAYQVCLLENEYYDRECVDEGAEYISSLIDKIEVKFNYDEKYSSAVDYKYSYYVGANIKVYNQDMDERLLYSSERVLSSKDEVGGSGDLANVSVSASVPFSKYREYVLEYINKYGINSMGNLDVGLYLEREGEVKKVAGISMPLTGQTISITKKELEDQGLLANSVINKYKMQFITYMIVALIFLAVLLINLIKLIFFFRKTLKVESPYNLELSRILKEYEYVIAEVRGMASPNRKVYKVKNFLELLDIRDTLGKPILYEKISDIKSDFYVEDGEILYTYTMKEADF